MELYLKIIRFAIVLQGLAWGLMPPAQAEDTTSSISADSTSIIAGASTTINWKCQNAEIGNVFIQHGTASNTVISSALEGSFNTGPLFQTTMYQANCAKSQQSAWIVSTVTILVDPTHTFTQTSVSTAAESFTSALKTSVDTSSIDDKAKNADGKQTNALVSAKEVSTLGAGQAATIGAVFCAQGANANLFSPDDAAPFYASCQQNFDAAKGLSRTQSGFNADERILNNSAAQESLQDFEKNFGIAPNDYISRMLGEGGGPGSLASMLDGQIPEAKLTEALDAAAKISPNESHQDPNQFAVNLGGSGSKKPATTLRDNLKKRLAEKDLEQNPRNPASSQSQQEEAGSRYEGLAPLTDEIFAANEGNEELSIFDVVHRRYEKLTAKMRPGKSLTP